MALTSTTTFDLVGQVQTLTMLDPSQVDQITFSSNTITFASSLTFNLSKKDMILYFKYLNAFNNILLINFPKISSSIGLAFPLSVFNLKETNVGGIDIVYNQTSNGTQAININYVPLTSTATFITRPAPVTISLQEFFFMIIMLNQFTNQVSLN